MNYFEVHLDNSICEFILCLGICQFIYF